MSRYGDDSYHTSMEDLYNEIKWFLEDHSVPELMRIVADVIEYEKEDIK